ncbi:MAG: MFS transporter [Chitinophagaceae bacterium]
MEQAGLRDSSTTQTIFKITALGFCQVLLWGGSYFLLSVLAKPIMSETGWSYRAVYSCLSVALLVSGLILPTIGQAIHSNNRNKVLPYAGIVMSAGLVVVGLSVNFALFVTGWIIIGFAMGMGLYDALFASLGKQHSGNVGKTIVWVTLLSSLAPSVSWNFTTLLLSHSGWRNTCFIYAAILLIVIYPVHRYIFRTTTNSHQQTTITEHPKQVSKQLLQSKRYRLVLASFTLGAIITTGLVIHLIDILSAKNMPATAVLTAIAFLGPSQAAARTLELVIRKRTAIEMAFIAACAMLCGIILFFLSSRLAIAGVILFGVGNGMRSVLRGTLPAMIFDMDNYAVIIGRLARLPLIAQAASPFIGGFIIQQWGTTVFLSILCVLAVINIVLTLLIRNTVNKVKPVTINK